MKHLLKLSDLSYEEINEIINLGEQLKYESKNGINHPHLKGKTLGMIFRKSSTRTRISFEVGMYQLGGHALFLSASDLQMGRGEEIEDTIKVLSRYLDGIMIRTFDQQEVEDMAEHGTIPIINGLTDYAHPCQVLADLMTIREYKGYLKGLKLCYVGDGNNMANSLIVGCIKMGMEVSIACPTGYEPDTEIMQWANNNGDFICTNNIPLAAKDADILYTDVWASMGQEKELLARKEVFSSFTIDEDLLNIANNNAIVLHCLPAHKGEEIQRNVFDLHADEIFNQAENRLHVQKAVLLKLLEDK